MITSGGVGTYVKRIWRVDSNLVKPGLAY